mgnify:CR=1 FL=1
MADTKISALTDGATADATDKIPIERAGANKYITPAYIQTFLTSIGGLTSFGVRSTGTGAFDLKLANAENLTVSDKTLTIQLGDTSRTLILGASPSLSGTNTGDQTITLTGDVTGTGTGSFAATIAADAVTYAKMQNISATNRLLGRATAGAGDTEEITLGTNLSYTGTTLNAASGASTLDGITAATADEAGIANADWNVRWNWAKITDAEQAFRFSESAAATGGTSTAGVPNQVLVYIDTVASSTMSPLSVYSRALHVFSVSPTDRQLLFTDGTVEKPAIARAAGVTTGIYFSAGAINMATIGANANVQQPRFVTSAGGNMTQLILDRTVLATEASLGIGAANSGFFGVDNNTLGLTIGGLEQLRWTAGVSQYSYGAADAVAYAFNFRKSRGTVLSPTVITTGDDLATISGYGYVGATNTYKEAGRILFDSTGTIADTTSGIGGIISLWTTLAGTDTAVQEGVRLVGGSVPKLQAPTDDLTTLGAAAVGFKALYLAYTNTATVGAVTINKASGRVNIAASGTSVVVTNSLVTAASHVFVVASTNDATARVTNVVPAAGSFTINTVAVTAETSFNFVVINAD